MSKYVFIITMTLYLHVIVHQVGHDHEAGKGIISS